MKLQKRIREGEMIPRLYAVAWEDWWCRELVAYPIGVHWLVMLLRWFERTVLWKYPKYRHGSESREIEQLKRELAEERRLRHHESFLRQQDQAAFDSLREQFVRELRAAWDHSDVLVEITSTEEITNGPQ